MTRNGRRIVLGLGNTLNTDEGLGVHALAVLGRALSGRTLMEFIDGGTLGLNLLPLVEESSHLLLLDAVDGGTPPGTVIELPGEQIPLFQGIKVSGHQVTFQEVLGLARVRDKFPTHLHLVGMQPAEISLGVGVSATVERMIPELLLRAERVLRSWGMIQDSQGA